MENKYNVRLALALTAVAFLVGAIGAIVVVGRAPSVLDYCAPVEEFGSIPERIDQASWSDVIEQYLFKGARYSISALTKVGECLVVEMWPDPLVDPDTGLAHAVTVIMRRNTDAKQWEIVGKVMDVWNPANLGQRETWPVVGVAPSWDETINEK